MGPFLLAAYLGKPPVEIVVHWRFSAGACQIFFTGATNYQPSVQKKATVGENSFCSREHNEHMLLFGSTLMENTKG